VLPGLPNPAMNTPAVSCATSACAAASSRPPPATVPRQNPPHNAVTTQAPALPPTPVGSTETGPGRALTS
jgi:hypothetical protein